MLTSCFRKTLEVPISLKLQNDYIVATIQFKSFEKLDRGGGIFFYGILRYKFLKDNNIKQNKINLVEKMWQSANRYDNTIMFIVSDYGENFYIRHKGKDELVYIDSLASVRSRWKEWAIGLNVETESKVYVYFANDDIDWNNAELVFMDKSNTNVDIEFKSK
ncbi:MAG: hypothetical protein LBV16_09465 [Elusimicrobiota bacterium]|nr:hypothetical protein [Elusimicrobiota bacterium]